MIEVLVMAPSPERRDRILSAISGDRSIRVAGSAAGFPSLRSLISETSGDLAVIDWQSQTDSTTPRDWLLEFLDLIPIVVLCSEPDSGIFSRILRSKAGAMILQTDISPEQIIQGIKSVAAGLLVFDSALMPQRSEDDPLAEELTPREVEVLRLLADGSGNKEIAARLNISEHTIKFHIRSILGKLGAASRTEAVTRGLRSGLIDL
jgi:NarL family two-component system response regulator YdfI